MVPWFVMPFIRLKIDDELNRYSISGSLEGFAEPILILGAKQDRTLSVKLARDLYEILDTSGLDTDYVEFPMANHLSIKTEEAFADTVVAFLDRIAQQAGF